MRLPLPQAARSDAVMKREKIYEFAINHPLTTAKSKAIEKHIEENARLSDRSVSYGWHDEDNHVLLIDMNPVSFEVRFHKDRIELFGAAHLWARLLFTDRRKAEFKALH